MHSRVFSNHSNRMKITRQLRLDALAIDGTALTQFTSSWEGNRLRVGNWAFVAVTGA